MRRETLGLAPQFRVERAGLRREASRRRSGGQPFEKRCRHSPTRFEIDAGVGARQQRHTGEKVRAVILPVGNAGVEDVDPGHRAIDLRGEVGERPEVGMRLQPANPESSAQCASLGSGRERTGIRRAARPKRKIVAAIRPIETPHSTIDGK